MKTLLWIWMRKAHCIVTMRMVFLSKHHLLNAEATTSEFSIFLLGENETGASVKLLRRQAQNKKKEKKK